MATPDFLPSFVTFESQIDPVAARLADGSFIVGWSSFVQDGDNFGVFLRRFDADGAALGPEVRVNSTTVNTQRQLALGALDDGGFVAVWQSLIGDNSGNGIYQQRFDRFGSPVGFESRVNITTFGDQIDAAVAGLEGGGHVVTWTSAVQDGSGTGIYAQVYGALGQRIGGEVRINEVVAGDQLYPDVTALPGGGFAAVFVRPGLTSNTVVIRFFAGDGSPAGFDTVVNNVGMAGNQLFPKIATLSGGDVMVTWIETVSGTVRARQFDPTGLPRGDEVVVADPMLSPGVQMAAVAALADGGSIIVWASAGAGFLGQRFDATGAAVGGVESVLGATPASGGTQIDVLGLAGGGFLTLADILDSAQPRDVIGAIRGQASAYDDVDTMAAPGLYDARAGNDRITGSAGDDTIFGGAGADILAGGDGDDVLRGGTPGPAGETLRGEGGSDVLSGSDAADLLDGGSEGDVLRARAGNDSLIGGTGDDDLRGGDGDDRMDGGDGADLLRGQAGADSLQGGTLVDRLFGGDGDDDLAGGTGGDQLYGDAGDDHLAGEGANDRLEGGAGDDILEGGTGADRFVFAGKTFADDVIRDFEDGIDRIELAKTAAATFAELAIGSFGSNALVSVGANSILVIGAAGLLDATDFVIT